MKRTLLACAVLATFDTSSARAAFMTYNSEAAFTAALTSSSVEMFGSPFAINGETGLYTFSDFTLNAAGQSVFPSAYTGLMGNTFGYETSAPQAITITFAAPVTGFGVAVGDFGTTGSGDFLVTTNNGGGFTAASGPRSVPNTFYFGVTSDTPFSTVTVRSTEGGDVIYLDNLQFGQAAPFGPSIATPLPPTALAAVVGLVGLAGLRRRFARA